MFDPVCKTSAPETLSVLESQSQEQEEPAILCRNCHKAVTRPGLKIQRENSFSHTFANPYGHVFEIGCFAGAAGCVKASPASGEFTWFRGYVWSVGVCRQCGTQLGWIFSSQSDTFYGLILDQLIFP